MSNFHMYQHVDYDTYGYVFQEMEGKKKTRIFHVNHMVNGVRKTLSRSFCGILTARKRNQSVYAREMRRLGNLKRECEEAEAKKTVTKEMHDKFTAQDDSPVAEQFFLR